MRLAVFAGAALLLSGAPASAHILDALMRDRKPQIRYKMIEIHPRYSVTMMYDDNIYRVGRDGSDGTRSGCRQASSVYPASAASCSGGFLGSWVVKNKVGLNTRIKKGGHVFKVGYDMAADNYKVQPKANDAISQSVSTEWSYKGPRLSARVWNDYLNTEDPPFNPNSPLNGELVNRENRWENEVGLSLRYDLADKFFVGVHASADRDKYLGPSLASVIDRSQSRFGVKVGYRIFPKTRVYADLDRSVTHYSAGRRTNHKDWSGVVGVEGNLRHNLKGVVEGGIRAGHYDLDTTNTTTQDFRRDPRSWIAKVSLEYMATPRTSLLLAANSSINEAAVSGSFYVSRGASLNLQHRLHRTTLYLSGGMQIDKYSESVLTEPDNLTPAFPTPIPGVNRLGEVVQRRDDSYTARIGFNYRIHAWLSVEAFFNHLRRHSILSRQFNYKANQTSVTLKAAF